MASRVKQSQQWRNKIKSLQGLESFFVTAPQIIANRLHDEVTTDELEGNPINHISGNLIDSIDVVKMGPYKWGIEHNKAMASYGKRVLIYVSIARRRAPVFTLLRERTYPWITDEILAQYRMFAKAVESGGVYKFDKKAFL